MNFSKAGAGDRVALVPRDAEGGSANSNCPINVTRALADKPLSRQDTKSRYKNDYPNVSEKGLRTHKEKQLKYILQVRTNTTRFQPSPMKRAVIHETAPLSMTLDFQKEDKSGNYTYISPLSLIASFPQYCWLLLLLIYCSDGGCSCYVVYVRLTDCRDKKRC